MAATTFALPKELNEGQRRELASGFAAGATEGEPALYAGRPSRRRGESPYAPDDLGAGQRWHRAEPGAVVQALQREGPGEGGSEEEPHHDVAGVGPWGRVQPVRTSQFPSRKGPERRGPKRGGPERDYGPSRVKFLPHGFSRAFTFVRRRATKFRSSKARNPTHSSTARDGVILMTAGGKFRMTVRTYR